MQNSKMMIFCLKDMRALQIKTTLQFKMALQIKIVLQIKMAMQVKMALQIKMAMQAMQVKRDHNFTMPLYRTRRL